MGIILSLCVALLASLGQVAWKFAIKKKADVISDEYSLSFWIRFFSTLILIPSLFFVPFPDSFGIKEICIIFVVVILSTISTITWLQAVKYGEISVVGPIGALALPLLLITTYVLTWEIPSIWGYIWVGVIFVWLYFLEWGMKNGIFWPLYSLFHDKGAKAMMITTLIQSITAPLDKIGISHFWIFHWLFLTGFFSLPLLFVYMKVLGKDLNIHHYCNKESYKKVSLLSFLMGFGLVLQMLAFKYTLVVYVISLKRTSWLFSVILWALIFKEKDIRRKLFASLLMFLWILVIIFYGNI